ncbi:serine O-acetyltransferase EpsC [Butyrivibrio sp. AE2032]|uniref:serine O-acetyltransferase EpsC n=1 Tax=Butyrivibrio sp. AE2032 TaxID=1458463 RepID=UPI000550FAE3|nr:serine O-acetyltransferase EpsC [Butyrivibrio sp. AE2032]
MEQNSREKEIASLVSKVISDYDGGKNIDTTDIYNKPDRNEVIDIINNLFFVVYPGYFKDRTYKTYNPKNEIAVMIEDIFYHLNKQVFLALDFCKLRGSMSEAEREKESYRICSAFIEKIPVIREYAETDLLATFDGDPAAGSFDEIILAYPGLIAITTYRLAHELYLLNVPVIPRLMTEVAHSKTGIDIHPGATIGKFFFIDHGTGIVVGETSVIGDNVKIYQGVTIGALSTRGGQKLAGKKRHPTIEDNVVIYAGASILGGETVIGKNSVIGGNTFITSSVPSDTRVSIKNPEMEYYSAGNKHVKEEIKQGDEWFYII